jgi:hypothetical protein
MPMVVMNEGVKLSSLNRRRQQDFPTPESPMRRSFICQSKSAGVAREMLREANQKVIVASSSHFDGDLAEWRLATAEIQEKGGCELWERVAGEKVVGSRLSMAFSGGRENDGGKIKIRRGGQWRMDRPAG